MLYKTRKDVHCLFLSAIARLCGLCRCGFFCPFFCFVRMACFLLALVRVRGVTNPVGGVM